MNKFIRFSLFFAIVSIAHAASFNFSGTFTRDDQAEIFRVSVASSATANFQTSSFARGGFSPVVSLFNDSAAGLLIGSDNGVDNANGEARLQIPLTAGTYTLVLTQYDNLAAGPRFANGFLRAGNASFTSEFAGRSGQFYDINGMERNGSFSLFFDNVDAAVGVPEPATFAIAGAGLLVLVWPIRKRKPKLIR